MAYDGIIGGVPVRENHDYVSFENYEHDTREIAELAENIISDLRRKLLQAERLLGMIVLAAGAVKVSMHDLHDQRSRIILTQWRNPSDDTVCFQAERE